MRLSVHRGPKPSLAGCSRILPETAPCSDFEVGNSIDTSKAINMACTVKTTLIIDDAVLKETKKYAAEHSLSMGEVVTRSFRDYLKSTRVQVVEEPYRVLTYGNGSSVRAKSMTPDEIAELRDDGR